MLARLGRLSPKAKGGLLVVVLLSVLAGLWLAWPWDGSFRFQGLVIRPADGCLALDRKTGPLVLRDKSRPCAFEVESKVPLVSIVLDLAREAPSRLEIEGGEQGVRLFRPDGTVVSQILLEPPAPAPAGERRRAYRYPLRLSLPGTGPGPLRLTLAAEVAGPSGAASTSPQTP